MCSEWARQRWGAPGDGDRLLRLRKLDEARQVAQRLANDEFAGGRARADAHEVWRASPWSAMI
jgi:hypothetical protein